MSFTYDQVSYSQCAGADFSDANGRAAALTPGTKDEVTVAVADDPLYAGVICGNPEQGKAVKLQHTGVVKVRSGAAFNRGDYLSIDANGAFIPGLAATAVAKALETVSGAGCMGAALLRDAI